jgi:cytochrome oxidase assembly protein ShyY1
MHFRPFPVLTIIAIPALAALISLGVWQLQRAELRQLARGDGADAGDAPSAARPASARPRSEQRRDNGFGNHTIFETHWPIV